MRHKPLMLFIFITIISSGTASANIISAQANQVVSNPQVTVKSITQQIIDLELQQAVLDVTFTPQNPVMQNTNRKLQSLRKNLAQLQPQGGKTAVDIAVSQAIKARIGKLAVERALLNVTYTPTSPVIQDRERKIKSLNKRFLQLQPNNQTALNVAISQAIKAKMEELKIERALLQTKYSATHPNIVQINSQLRSLETHLVSRR
ncbi:hypothetical protein [Anabaena azotica]|uniref:Uncharacterized protein n=1 Tax=Anabaena azotica FACHB-119 TaxID=947527 RepID=A0ABR8D5E5_9NOST|nr:hypothetical protein [Anabaena azotica]MBD2500978.1 hypothetical protein [Anabaena azotica FACHB-119]